MSAQILDPLKLYVETAYSVDTKLQQAIAVVRKNFWHSDAPPSDYLSGYQYLVSQEALLGSIYKLLPDEYHQLFKDVELYHLIIHGQVWLYEAGFAVQELDYGYLIQVGRDISLKSLTDIWQKYIKPKQIESRKRGPDEYKMLYAIKRATVKGNTPKEIAQLIVDGKLEYYPISRAITDKEISTLLNRTKNIHSLNDRIK